MATARTTDTDAIRDTDLDKELADVALCCSTHCNVGAEGIHMDCYLLHRDVVF